MDVKRLITAVIGLPAVILVFLFGNRYVIDLVILGVSIICMYEYFHAIKKVCNPVKWVGYLSSVYMTAIALVSDQLLFMKLLVYYIPVLVLILFLHVIITNMKITLKDIAYTLIGIIYVPLFIMFLELIRCLEHGKVLIGYVFVVSWATDIFAYIIGKNFGKHKFSKVSPKKSIEGCVAGLIGSVIVSLLYTWIAISFWNIEVSYLYIAIISFILSAISQVGDFVASCVKRTVDVKDYSNLLPGHGGLLDRVDSLIFIAPFVYMLFVL